MYFILELKKFLENIILRLTDKYLHHIKKYILNYINIKFTTNMYKKVLIFKLLSRHQYGNILISAKKI